MPTLVETRPEEMLTLADLLGRLITTIKETVPFPVAFDLGCGKNLAPGCRGVDIYCEAEIQADLFKFPWTFTPDDSVDLFHSSHFVEHVPDWEPFFEEVWKKLKVGGYVFITTPYGWSNRAFQDPDHKQFITEARYWYLVKEWREKNNIDHYQTKVNFEYKQFWPIYNKEFVNYSDEAKEFAMKHYVNAVDDISVLLRKAE